MIFLSSRGIRSISVAGAAAAIISAQPAMVMAATGNTAPQGGDGLCVTIFHNNDGESQLIDAGSGKEDFGGIARFASRLKRERFIAENVRGCVSLTLTSGDNFLAGPEFTASLEKGAPYYDTIGLSLIRYDAMALGNHDFDFGPDVTADFIRYFYPAVPFLSANLDFSDEPSLADLEEAGRIAGSVIVEKDGERFGIIGATTENLPFISSPRDVIVGDVLPAVQTELAKLEAAGVDKIILISHLQDIDGDIDLIGQLQGVDIAIAGGGDELLANDGDLLIPGDEDAVFGPYPLMATDAMGNEVPVVTTSGNYEYFGRLEVSFDDAGVLRSVNLGRSGPVRVAGGDNPDAVQPAPLVQMAVVEPVQAFADGLAAQVIGTTEVALNGVRDDVRSIETNLGNLITDALLWQATELAAEFGAPVPDVALQNGGGIRNDDVRGPGELTELDTFDILPFTNFVTIVPDVPRAQFKDILENAVSRLDPPAAEGGSGRFAQIAGFAFTYDLTGTPYLDEDGDGFHDDEGNPPSRIVDVMLADGTMIIDDGLVQPGTELTVATIDFLGRGGDQYPFRGLPIKPVGVTYQQALSRYIQDALGGLVSAGSYPEGGGGRILDVTP